MAKGTNSYNLPNNPLTAAGVFDELKRLKGDKAWLEFELELLTAQYPDNKVLCRRSGKVPGQCKPIHSHRP
jgi:hypothetical protein